MDNNIHGKARGGAARAAKMTESQRKEHSLKMVAAKKERALLPRSAYPGQLEIGDMTIPCCVLEDGRRIISEAGITAILGVTGGKTYRLRNKATKDGQGPMPLFLASKALEPFIGETFSDTDLSVIEYIDGAKITRGYDAKILPKVCEVWLRANEEKALQPSQLIKAKKAEILIRGLAYVGIIALVDEATGYQYERPRKELEEQLRKFLSESLRKWVRTFPSDYFKHLCRLRGVELREDMKLPQYFGHLTNNLVYRRMAPGLLKRLKERKSERGSAGNKLNQWLSLDYGVPELLVHLGIVIAVMKQHTDYGQFERALENIAPIYPEEPGLFDNPDDWVSR